MKVAVYSGEIPSTTFIERLIIGLAESGVKVVLHGKKRGAVRYSSKNITKIGFRGPLGQLWLVFKFAFLFAMVKPGTFQALIDRCPAGVLSWGFLKWFAKVGPIVWHKPDLFHLQWTKGVEEWVFLRDFGIRFVVSLRGSQINYSPLADECLAEVYRNTFPLVHGFHGVSKCVCTAAAAYGAEPARCRVVYSGLELSSLPKIEPKKGKNDICRILSVGRPHWVKGYHHALDAMRLLKDQEVPFHYVIVGGSSEELIFQVSDLGLEESVSLEGSMDFDGVIPLISESDILLLSSVEEGVPNVILEAMALGTVVVSTDCGAVREIITDGENGFLVPVRDPRAIADMVKAVAELCECELDRIRMRARTTIELQHDKRKMVDDMIDFYQVVLKSR